jgi:hypothetical protein
MRPIPSDARNSKASLSENDHPYLITRPFPGAHGEFFVVIASHTVETKNNYPLPPGVSFDSPCIRKPFASHPSQVSHLDANHERSLRQEWDSLRSINPAKLRHYRFSPLGRFICERFLIHTVIACRGPALHICNQFTSSSACLRSSLKCPRMSRKSRRGLLRLALLAVPFIVSKDSY